MGGENISEYKYIFNFIFDFNISYWSFFDI